MNAEQREGRSAMRDWNRLEFEWDEEKAAANLRKHKIDFRDAALVFNDENHIEYYDEANSVFEDRYNVIGMVDDILFVVYTERGEKIRIISARLATPMERRAYYDRNLFYH